MRRPKSWSAVCHQYLPAAEHLLPRVDRARRGPRRPFGGPQAEAPAAAQVGEAVGEGVEALQAKAIRVEMKIGGAAAPFANDLLGRFHRRFCRSNDVRALRASTSARSAARSGVSPEMKALHHGARAGR